MMTKVLKKDFARNRSATAVVFVLLLLSTLLVSGGTMLISGMVSSLDHLFATARVPHVVQMHAGDIDQRALSGWADTHENVADRQVVEMISIPETNLHFGQRHDPASRGIMDIGFVTQNEHFDFLLDMDNRVLHVAPGEVAVPLYYRQALQLQVGDTIAVSQADFRQNFIIADFLRDGQMNPALVHSKRFLVHASDYARLQTQFADREYLIEFRLNDPSRVSEFTQDYLASGLPNQGPTVDVVIFKLLNALSDGIVAIAVTGLSLLVVLIAVLCLRFTVLSSIEEDWREIGVMKAIGLSNRYIKRLYLIKYIALSAPAAAIGYGLSYGLYQYLAADMMLYLGQSPTQTALNVMLPLLAATALLLVVILSCLFILRRIGQTTAVDALRAADIAESTRLVKFLPLHKARFLPVNALLGIKDMVQRYRVFGLLGLVFFFSASVLILPMNFLTTLQSPSFITYLGIGKSDVRIDLQPTAAMDERYQAMVRYLAADQDVARFAPQVTSRYTVLRANGERQALYVQSGDLSTFPNEYLRGRAPEHSNELALSVLNSSEMALGVGDTLNLLVNEEPVLMTISGVYQDITNGGRTAKSVLPFNFDTALWYTVSLDLNDPETLADKSRVYAAQFHPARVTDLDGYLEQTLGGTLAQLQRVVIAAVGVGLVVAVLITALLLSMVLVRDRARIGILSSIGFSWRDLRFQYLVTVMLLLLIGLVLGTWFANTGGQHLISAGWSVLGATDIQFVLVPWLTYGVLPLLLLVSVTVTALCCLRNPR